MGFIPVHWINNLKSAPPLGKFCLFACTHSGWITTESFTYVSFYDGYGIQNRILNEKKSSRTFTDITQKIDTDNVRDCGESYLEIILNRITWLSCHTTYASWRALSRVQSDFASHTLVRSIQRKYFAFRPVNGTYVIKNKMLNIEFCLMVSSPVHRNCYLKSNRWNYSVGLWTSLFFHWIKIRYNFF